MSAQPTNQPGVQLKYIDRPEIAETFVDSVEKILVDHTGLRLEFVVNRYDDSKPPAALSGRKYTACRVVMPLQGFFDMVGRLNGLMQSLQQQGVIKPASPAPTPPPGKAN
jgi:hypothetical protein